MRLLYNLYIETKWLKWLSALKYFNYLAQNNTAMACPLRRMRRWLTSPCKAGCAQLLAPQHEVDFGTKSILLALEWWSVLSSTVTAQRSIAVCHPRTTQRIQRAINSEPNASASRWRPIVASTGRHLGVQAVGTLNYLRPNMRSTSLPNQSYLHWNN